MRGQKAPLLEWVEKSFGAMKVLAEAPYPQPNGRNIPGFLVEYTCCGAQQVVTRERLYGASRRPPQSCRVCAPPPPMPRRTHKPVTADGQVLSEADLAEIALVEVRERLERWRSGDAARARALRAENGRRERAAMAVRMGVVT